MNVCAIRAWLLRAGDDQRARMRGHRLAGAAGDDDDVNRRLDDGAARRRRSPRRRRETTVLSAANGCASMLNTWREVLLEAVGAVARAVAKAGDAQALRQRAQIRQLRRRTGR